MFSCRGLKLIRAINHIALSVIVTLITLLEAHCDSIAEIAGRCLQIFLGYMRMGSVFCQMEGGADGVFALVRCPGD